MITTHDFKDGIAFYKNEREIAFYNRFTNNIHYMVHERMFEMNIDLDTWLFIAKEIHKYNERMKE